MAITTPRIASAMPTPRRQPTFSPSSTIASSTVIGAPDRLTMPAVEGLALASPMAKSAKDPPPMASPTAPTSGQFFGSGRSSGASTMIVSSARSAA